MGTRQPCDWAALRNCRLLGASERSSTQTSVEHASSIPRAFSSSDAHSSAHLLEDNDARSCGTRCEPQSWSRARSTLVAGVVMILFLMLGPGTSPSSPGNSTREVIRCAQWRGRSPSQQGPRHLVHERRRVLGDDLATSRRSGAKASVFTSAEPAHGCRRPVTDEWACGESEPRRDVVVCAGARSAHSAATVKAPLGGNRPNAARHAACS